MKTLRDKNRLIDFVILNALSSKHLNRNNIYLLTSNSKNNKKLIKYVKRKYNIKVVIGPEENVLKRYKYFKRFKNFP